MSEPRKLGLVGKALIAAMVMATAGLGVGAVVLAVERAEKAGDVQSVAVA